MTTRKVTRDVVDFVTRAIEYDGATNEGGIIIDGSADPGGLCSGTRFAIDAVPIGQGQECNGKFALLEATGNLIITGTGSFGGALDMNSNQINELADGTLATDAITLGQADLRYVNLSGDTMVGALTLGGAESVGADAADRDYADSAASSAASAAVGAYNGFGSGQFWQFNGALSHNTTYPNPTPKPMYVSVAIDVPASAQTQFVINGFPVCEQDIDTPPGSQNWQWHGGVVPVGGTFRLSLLSGAIFTQRWYYFSL